MSDEKAENSPKIGEYYLIWPDYDAPAHEVDFVNADRLRPTGQVVIRPKSGGFPELSEVPLLHQTHRNHDLGDFNDGFEGYWLVSHSLKNVLEGVDARGFEFVKCEYRLFDGSVGPNYYLCDVLRSLDAIDDDASEVEILTDGFALGKFYNIAKGARLAFKKDVISGAHIFRSPFDDFMFVCDRVMRDALVEQGFGAFEGGRGMAIYDAADY